MYVKGDAPDAAISFLRTSTSQAEDVETRKALRKQLDQAILERDAAALEAAAEAYATRLGVRPITPVQLAFEGLASAVPEDPFGGEYYLDAKGRVRSTVHDRRFERPRRRPSARRHERGAGPAQGHGALAAMMKILAIAAVTVREALRRKLQVNLLLFALLLVLASLVVSSLTIGDMHRIATDLGLTAMELMGSLTAVFLGASLVAGDVERRVLYPVIAKPVTRAQYLLGRYLGLAATLWLNLAVMAATLSALLVLEAGSLRPLDTALLSAFAMMGVQFLVVAAVAVLFSSVTTPTLAGDLRARHHARRPPLERPAHALAGPGVRGRQGALVPAPEPLGAVAQRARHLPDAARRRRLARVPLRAALRGQRPRRSPPPAFERRDFR